MPRIAASTMRWSSTLSTYSRRTRSMTSATSAADSIVGSSGAATAVPRAVNAFQTVLDSASPSPNTTPVSSTTRPRRVGTIRCSYSPGSTVGTLSQGRRANANAFGYVAHAPSPGRGALGNPRARIDGLAVEPNLEVQGRPRLPARVADLRDRLAGRDPVAGLLEQRLVVTVEGHVAAAVIDDDEEAEAGEPVGERDATVMDGPHGRARGRFEQHAVPFDGTGAARLPVGPGDAPLHGPGELALRARKRLVRFDGKIGHDLAQAQNEVREPLLLCAQLCDGRSSVANLLVGLRDGGAALVARFFEVRELACLRRFEGRKLRFDALGLALELRERC